LGDSLALEQFGQILGECHHREAGGRAPAGEEGGGKFAQKAVAFAAQARRLGSRWRTWDADATTASAGPRGQRKFVADTFGCWVLLQIFLNQFGNRTM